MKETNSTDDTDNIKITNQTVNGYYICIVEFWENGNHYVNQFQAETEEALLELMKNSKLNI